MSQEKIKILLVDDHTLVREGFAKMIETEPDMEVVGEASDADSAYQLVRLLHPELILMDIRLRGTNGIQATRRIKEEFPEIEVIILSMLDEEGYFLEAIQAGAGGYILKDASALDLIQAIRTVHSGESLMQPGVAQKVLREYVQASQETAKDANKSPLRELSERELEVLHFVAEGHSNKEIASTMLISSTTVKAHLRSIFRKMDVNDRAQAVALAIRKGLV